ncbi:putative transmembrane protein [Toxoplasma gondii TgCatPRC2]|uniref:Transmembrane protein n=2 Tax=Toxoplasma gondii TaxID=5811 RepID=A0A139XZM7_TOXGO|nr:hypothetical protein TGARI_202620 [Toxoplasma gondii ARI]KYK66510.1 putative transmembrane protein [Toxoplasma gondii TgCatPRC2]
MKLFRPVYALLALPGGALAANYDFFVLGQPAGNGNLQSTGDTSADPAGEREGKPNESRSKDLEQGSTGPDYNVYYPRKQSTHLLPAVQQYSLKASPCAGEGAGQYIPSLSQSPSQPLQQYAPVHSTGEALGGSEASWKLPPHKASTETTLSQPSSSSEMETLSQTNPQQFIPVYGGNLLQPRPRALPGCDLDLPEPQKQKGCLVHSELRPSIILIHSGSDRDGSGKGKRERRRKRRMRHQPVDTTIDETIAEGKPPVSLKGFKTFASSLAAAALGFPYIAGALSFLAWWRLLSSMEELGRQEEQRLARQRQRRRKKRENLPGAAVKATKSF